MNRWYSVLKNIVMFLRNYFAFLQINDYFYKFVSK